VTTAAQAGLATCLECGLLVRWTGVREDDGDEPHCPRCGSEVSLRKPHSLTRTWALLIAAYLLYVPANVLPVMRVVYAGSGEDDTIFSGVKVLFATGQPAVAVLVLFASITVPLIKMVGLTFMALSVHRRWDWRRRDRTRLYRLIEFVGRWSMLDIFMISILVALVKLKALSTIEAGPGAVWFASVVILTMFAAESFDPRLMWDTEGSPP
jgi:paraquat-inducible protein A